MTYREMASIFGFTLNAFKTYGRFILKGKKSLKFTEQEIVEKLKDRPYLSIDYSTYKSSGEKCRFIDSDFGDFWMSLESLLKTKGHLKRKRAIAKSSEVMFKRVKAIQNDLDRKVGHKKLRLVPESFVSILDYANFVDADYGECRLCVSSVLYGASMHKKRKAENRIRSSLEPIKKRIFDMYGDLLDRGLVVSPAIIKIAN